MQYRSTPAVVPKPQPHLCNAWFQGIHMRTHEVNAVGYRRSALITFAAGLNGRRLMITGSGEKNLAERVRACACDQQVSCYHSQMKVQFAERMVRWALATQYDMPFRQEPAQLVESSVVGDPCTMTAGTRRFRGRRSR